MILSNNGKMALGFKIITMIRENENIIIQILEILE
jgi:hypothetical protein